MNNRISFDEYFLNIAEMVSKRSTCLKRQYGAVIVNSANKIISTGYNGSPSGEINCCERGTCPRLNKPHNSGDYSDCCAVHAEQNAMLFADGSSMIGGTLYLVGMENGKRVEDVSPCPICARMIKNANLKVITKF